MQGATKISRTFRKYQEHFRFQSASFGGNHAGTSVIVWTRTPLSMHVKLLALLVLFAGALHLAAAVATDANKIISIFVGLKQQNMDKLHVRTAPSDLRTIINRCILGNCVVCERSRLAPVWYVFVLVIFYPAFSCELRLTRYPRRSVLVQGRGS